MPHSYPASVGNYAEVSLDGSSRAGRGRGAATWRAAYAGVTSLLLTVALAFGVTLGSQGPLVSPVTIPVAATTAGGATTSLIAAAPADVRAGDQNRGRGGGREQDAARGRR